MQTLEQEYSGHPEGESDLKRMCQSEESCRNQVGSQLLLHSGGARDSMLPGHSQVNCLANQVKRKSKSRNIMSPCQKQWHSIINSFKASVWFVTLTNPMPRELCIRLKNCWKFSQDIWQGSER